MLSQPKTLQTPLAKDRGWQMLPEIWRFLLITVLVIGIVFRFANLERKVFWFDENATIFKISGYTIEAWDNAKNKLNGQIINIEDFQKSYSPNPQSNVTDTINL